MTATLIILPSTRSSEFAPEEANNLFQRNGLVCELIPPHLSLIWNAFLLPYKSGYAETIHAFNMFYKGIEHNTRYVLKLAVARGRTKGDACIWEERDLE
jgi:hypothetical protein